MKRHEVKANDYRNDWHCAGSGKTLSAVYECYKYYKRGFKVYSNIQLNFPHQHLSIKQLRIMIENKEQLQDAVLFVDECHIFLDSRSSMTKKNKVMSYFILQTRKRNVRMIVTTQHLGQLEKRLRDTIDILVFCKNLSNKTSTVLKDAEFNDMFIEQTYLFQWAEDTKPKKKIILGNPVFKLYSTQEIVDFNDDD